MASILSQPQCVKQVNDKKKKDFLEYLNNELVIQTVEAHLAKK